MARMIKAVLVLAAGCLLACTQVLAAELPRVRVTTNQGDFVIELEAERAPLTVENFLRYVRAGHYSGTIFHRVIQGFVIQGGGLDTTYVTKPVSGTVVNESGNGLRNRRGTVGMARASRPHSGDCQFYVNVADNGDLDPLPTRWGYTVFGRIVEGMEIIDRISFLQTGAAGPLESDAPLKPVVIEKVVISTTAPPPP